MERQLETSTLSLKSVFPEGRELTKNKQTNKQKKLATISYPRVRENSTVSSLNQKGFIKNII